MEKNILKVENVSKSFSEDNQVLRNISFSIDANEQVAIIGPSGSGKSTLMNIIMKILPPDSGEVFINNKAITEYVDNKTYARQVGMIQQSFNLVDTLSVLQNVQVGRLHEWRAWESLINLVKPIEREKSLEVLNRVGIKGKANNKIYQLSGGEKQRVAIARLMMQDPQIILADEPVSSLDPARANEVLQLLVKLSKEEGKTLIASIHSINLVKSYFDRVIGIRDGKILFDRSVQEMTTGDVAELYRISGEANDEEVR